MAKTFFQEHIPYIVARITIQTQDKTGFGTGFFYHAPLNDGTDHAIMLLISNRHVFLDRKGKLAISLNRKKEDGTPEFGNIRTFRLDLDLPTAERLYFPHPNSDVDLACVNVSAIRHTDAFCLSVHDKLLQTIDYKKVLLGSEVIFVGYPQGLYDPVNNLPLIRKGFIASMPDVDFNGKGHIVIDAQIFQGSSGSPVFVSQNGKYLLLGVVSDTIVREARLEILPTNMSQNLSKYGVKEGLGLGIVVKQRHIRELIDYAVNEHIRRMSPNS